MQQALAFLNIRVRQAVREVLRSGPVYGSILILGSIALLTFFYFSQKSIQHIIYSYSGLTVLIFILHMQRNDHRFIQLFGLRPALIFFTEYTALLLPFFFLTLIKSGQFFPLLILVIVGLISFLKINVVRKNYGKFPVFFTGNMNFEWKAGLRKSGWILVVMWVAALLLTPVPYASIVLLWFILLTISTFYESNESRNMVEAFEMPEGKFLWMKIHSQSLLFCAIALPVLICSAVFFPSNWWISVFFLCFSVINIGVFVVSKYSVWGSGETHGSVTMINTFCLVGFFLPFLLPLPIFVLIRNYYRALKNLKPVLHAFA